MEHEIHIRLCHGWGALKIIGDHVGENRDQNEIRDAHSLDCLHRCRRRVVLGGNGRYVNHAGCDDGEHREKKTISPHLFRCKWHFLSVRV